MTDKPWGVSFTPQARRDLRRLDPQVARRILGAIDRLLAQDTSLTIRRLTGSTEARIRVGDWRVRFTRDTDTRQIII